MKNSIGLWMDSKLQKQIKCCENNDLKDIYERMYIDPNRALNQIRQKIEKLFENFFNQNNLRVNTFQSQLASSNKLDNDTLIKKHFLNKFNNDRNKTNTTLDLIYSYGNLTRVYGNAGSHNGEHDNEELAQMAIISFMAFFELNKIFFNRENKYCENFNSLIYNKLEVIYETKDDVEEWEKIRFNKLKFNYDLYQVDVLNKPILDKIIQKERERNSSKNIYFLNLKNYKNFKKMYQELEDIEEKDYFKIERKIIDIDTIDMIPLRVLPKDEAHPYKWDMCYVNLSIEFDDFGVDLILFLNFNQEKFNSIQEEYHLEIQDL
ncbi:MAG TPA: hypothetical protein EYG80_06355 [Flavobacteriaceae bacterium]|nr:hypothetical protein [Flavobacteriaceae bacterium]